VKALVRAGWKENQIEVHDEAQHLVGYQGDQRKDKANVIIRRKYVGGASNDLGFVLQEDGTYKAIVSEYDRSKHRLSSPTTVGNSPRQRMKRVGSKL
jgi:hypothetical protein